MTHTLYKVGSAVASGAMLLAALGPVASADTSITESGNGAFSHNAVNLSQTSTTTVSQNNTANISNSVNTSANSGKNSAFGNTGGSVQISTGPASTTTEISNAANTNVANVSPCGPCNGNTTLKISGNGAVSDSTINVDMDKTNTLSQNNTANIDNDVRTHANSGENDATFNTGGNVGIRTGAAGAAVRLATDVNHNVASMGTAGAGQGSSLSIIEDGNGAFSFNSVNASLDTVNTLSQNNLANVSNDVDADANSGRNSEFANTGGSDLIQTGPAGVAVDVLNRANFNWAQMGNCCVGNTEVKEVGNGFDSFNTANLALTNTSAVAQNNDLECGGHSLWPIWELTPIWLNGGDKCADVRTHANSGDNLLDFSTGDPGADPAIQTSGASTSTSVTNIGNSNEFNSGSTGLPSPFPTNLSSSSSWSAWWAFWHMGM